MTAVRRRGRFVGGSGGLLVGGGCAYVGLCPVWYPSYRSVVGI